MSRHCYSFYEVNLKCQTTDSRPKLVAGSPEGYYGHVDGRPKEARMNHPKGLTVDDRGNIYIADTMNMAIRKISDTGRFFVYFMNSLCQILLGHYVAAKMQRTNFRTIDLLSNKACFLKVLVFESVCCYMNT